MASNGRNILNTALGLHNSAVNTYGQLDSATKKFQNRKHSKSIIKSAKDNIFEFPVFVSSNVPMDYATATNTLLEQCYASYLQMGITAQGPIISATEARNGTQFAKFKSDTNKYLEHTEMQYAHDACHNFVQEANYSVEFSLLSYEDSDARVINEAVDYQPLSEFEHFFQEESIQYNEYDWDTLYMEATTNRNSSNKEDFTGENVRIPYPEIADLGNGPEMVTTADNNIIFQIENGHFRTGTIAEVSDFMHRNGINADDALDNINSIQSQAHRRGIAIDTPARIAQLEDENYNRLWDKYIREISNIPNSERFNANGNGLSHKVETKIKDAESALEITDGSLKDVIQHLYENEQNEITRQTTNIVSQVMRNITAQIAAGIEPTAEQQAWLDKYKDYGAMTPAEAIEAAQQAKKWKDLDTDHKNFQAGLDIIAKGGSLKDARSKIPGLTAASYQRIRGEMTDKANLTKEQLRKERTNNMLQDALNLSEEKFWDKYSKDTDITEKEYERLKSIAKSDEKSKSSKAESDRLTAITNKIRAGAKDFSAVGHDCTETEFNAIKAIVDKENAQTSVRLSSDRFKAITDKIDRNVAISDKERQDAGLSVEAIERMQDLAKVRHEIEKHNEEILKRQATKTKGFYRALDDIKTTADTASAVGQAVATGTRAAKEIATFKSDVETKKAQASSAKTEAELKKKQLRDYEKDKDLERRSKEQQIESSKHQMKMAEQQARNASKAEGPKFIDETKIQKLNTLKPMLMSVDLRVMDDDGGLSTPVQYIVGVKTHCRLIDAEILPEVAEYPLKKMDEMTRKIKWRAGELKFLKDIVFKIEEKKQTAADKRDPRRNWYRRLYDLAHMKGDAPAAKVAEGKSLFETYFKDKIGKGKAITGVIPNASIVITQADVNNIKAQTKLNLLKASSARKFCKELFLLGFVIIDDDAESIKVMFPDLHNEFEVHSLASVKKQVSMLDTAGTKTKDMFKLLG